MAAAKLIGWGARVLYLGPAFGLTPHRNATAVLAVGLDAPLEVADDPAEPMTNYRATRSVLILPNSLHHLHIERGRMAFLYVDPLGRDLKALIARMTNPTPRAAFDLRGEAAVIWRKTASRHGMAAHPSANCWVSGETRNPTRALPPRCGRCGTSRNGPTG
jgi:hypothetical protein